MSLALNFRSSILRSRLNRAWTTKISAGFSSLPSHRVVPMPSLSPTMEAGSIAKWNVTVGDRFETGTSLCEVETDKATVSFDATDEGYIAKILVSAGEIKVGQPLLVTVDEKDDVKAFENFAITAGAAPSTPVKATPPPVASQPAPVMTPTPAAPAAPSSATGRIFASPLAKKLVREQNLSLVDVSSALQGKGSGFNGRIVASDVEHASRLVKSAAVAAPAAAATSAPPAQAPAAKSSAPSFGSDSIYQDFEVSDVARALIDRQSFSKKVVPHYHVSVEINMGEALRLRQRLNTAAFAKQQKEDSTAGLTVTDFVAKAAALAMNQVPDVNASWMETFVRRYEQVDINFIMGSGSSIAMPVVKAVESKGLSSISKQLLEYEKKLFSKDVDESKQFLSNQQVNSVGTFAIYNLGMYGIKAAAPIVITPQAAALSIGAIIDTVVPKATEGDGPNWDVAPIMVATLTCDHRVVDGATCAQWLSAFKLLLEKPETLLL